MSRGRRRLLADLCLIVLLIALGAFLLFQRGAEGSTVEIRVNGELYGSHALSADKRIDIVKNDVLLGTAVIEDGTVRVENALCDGKDCEKSGRISEVGRCIVCLPCGVTVTVKGDGGLDGVTG